MDSVGVFLVTGPSASGKTTVASLLALEFSRGVHLEGDIFRRSIAAGREEIAPEPSREALSQLLLRYRIAAAAADAYCEEAFVTVWEDVIAGAMLDRCVELVRSRPLHVIVLLPGVDVVASRDAARPNTGYKQWPLETLHTLFAKETPRIGLWLDSGRQTPEETVREIRRRSQEARV